LDVLVSAVDFVIDDFAHPGGVHERNAAEIEDGVVGRICAAKQGPQGGHVIQGYGPDEAEDDGSRFGARNWLDLQGGIECHRSISVWNGTGFVAGKLVNTESVLRRRVCEFISKEHDAWDDAIG
jgi:hypothetical protein